MSAPLVQAAIARTDEARGQLRQAGLGLNPRLFLQSEDWRPWDKDFNFPTQTEDYAFLSQTLELDGKRHKRADVADARLGEARAQEQITRFTIAGRVAAAYWSAAVLERTVALLKDDMQAWTRWCVITRNASIAERCEASICCACRSSATAWK